MICLNVFILPEELIVKTEKLSEKERVNFDLGNCVIIECEIGEEVIMKIFELYKISLEPVVRIIFNCTAWMSLSFQRIDS